MLRAIVVSGGGDEQTKNNKRCVRCAGSPQLRSICIDQVNRMDQDPPAQVAKDREMRVLSEINELQDFENENWSRGTV